MHKQRKRKKRKLNPDGSQKRNTTDAKESWKQRQYELGNCVTCGQPRGDSPYKRWCRRHGALNRLKFRRGAGGIKPWRRGITKNGQPPRDWQVNDRLDVDRFFPAVIPKKRMMKKEEDV